jgi:glutathione synthase/RimK-type ligase-like ATP-grasp enzyme
LALYFITQAGRGYIQDDRLLIPALENFGVAPIELPWSAGLEQVTAEDTLVIRAIWDYHLRPAEFAAWLDDASRIGCKLINPEPLLRWNYQKSYLREIALKGAPMPQTFFFDSPVEFAKNPPQLSPETEYVVKPIISASAHGTFRVTANAVAPTVSGFSYHAFLVQEFLPEIVEGEWSLIFIGGRFSHAVKKMPPPGEFRVQSEFGGRVVAEVPPEIALMQAEQVITLLPQMPVYARIDLIMRRETALLIEIELIEPDLFLSTHEPAAESLARFIATEA